MKIGILGDTHDHLPNIRKAISIFNDEEVDLVIHCGDFVSLFVIKEFKELNSNIIAVYGNNDGEREKLKEWLLDIDDKNIISDFHSIEIDGLKFFITHGHYKEVLDLAINSGLYDVVVYGHTHKKLFETYNNTLIINPGECCGYLTGEATIGILDTKEKAYREIIL
ncbi:MJ0936 family phosphodiesterase [Methanocaldococcus infernus]|uniref:Phosphoesterase n=1 Tax=Methanocaldococcus infernus (strain DSM 11812 / JCM 15783 / ME) TaxID=573063 RepID=D5VQB7_METIM|nr:MJ0936 family phosphodiesterase [Methanocaldococcus infernus]ADG12770.1 phosphodiesterase, MJ0936 family [Methanocaldococcus infernus ME]